MYQQIVEECNKLIKDHASPSIVLRKIYAHAFTIGRDGEVSQECAAKQAWSAYLDQDWPWCSGPVLSKK